MHRDLEIRLAVAVDVGLHDIVGRDEDYPVPLRLAVAAVIGGETLGDRRRRRNRKPDCRTSNYWRR